MDTQTDISPFRRCEMESSLELCNSLHGLLRDTSQNTTVDLDVLWRHFSLRVLVHRAHWGFGDYALYIATFYLLTYLLTELSELSCCVQRCAVRLSAESVRSRWCWTRWTVMRLTTSSLRRQCSISSRPVHRRPNSRHRATSEATCSRDYYALCANDLHDDNNNNKRIQRRQTSSDNANRQQTDDNELCSVHLQQRTRVTRPC